MSQEPIIAYCVKCKEKREMGEPEAVYTANGTPGTRGVCPVCGTKMFKMGRTPAHESIPAPDPKTVKAKRKAAGKNQKKSGKARKNGKLVIVESPAKAKTIGKFLGKGYTVKASVGHIRDLLRSQLSVDVDNEFAPKYRVPNEKRPVVKELKKLATDSSEIYLATDPDREGEAIAWHLTEAADMAHDRTKRVVFHEITKDAVAEAFAHPRDIDMDRVNAQQARRILDRLVGYQISPLLWRKVRSRTSAGRVQSVALRLIVEREQEVDEFNPVEYWSIEADLAKKDAQEPFRARLSRIGEEKVDLKHQADTQAIVDELAKLTYVVEEVKKSERRRRPAAPFTTSTLQQEASRRLGFGARKTMSIAQQLYEGIDLGSSEGSSGLITYMRTDSMNVSKQAQEEARKFIGDRYGAELVPEEPPVYKTKSKGAQEAHEAIRPTSVWREPDHIKSYLSRDQLRLYTLIWQRFVSSQMERAIYDTMSITIGVGPSATPPADNAWPYRFQASGSRVRFKGFLTVYEESRDEDAAPDESEGIILPELTEGDVVNLVELLPNQHFTQPPPRYTEASLVKTLEEYGIGRPSTYAPIISTIQQRGYVEKFEKRLYPTELGEIVNDLLTEYFPDIVNVQFTAQMEEDLDRIAEGDRQWPSVLQEFYSPFAKAVAYAEDHMPEISIADQPTGEICEKCGSPMVLKFGRYGKFEACSNFPECRNAKPHLVKLGIACPNDGGELVERRTKKGRVFYGCSNYPECEWSSWKRPLPNPCPNCQGLLVQKNRQWAQCTECEEQFLLNELPAVDSEPETQKPELMTA